MKTFISGLIIAFALSAYMLSCIHNNKPVGNMDIHATVDVDSFNNGDILLPNYVHDDTLIVTNAEFLNDNIDDSVTDSEINNLLIKTTQRK